jgi:carboxyl-terminal processing protease
MKKIFKNISNKVKILVITAVLIVSSFSLISYEETNFEIAKNLDIYYTLFKELNIFYVDEVDAGDLVKTSIDQMLKSLDPYTTYIPESKIEDFKFMTTGQYGGIGALIRKKDDFIVISEPYENFPAYKAGLIGGDVIIEIDGKSTKGKSTSDISEALKGQPNTEVTLLIDRPGSEENITKVLMREEVKIKSVPYYGMLNDSVGYIKLTSFTRNANKDVKEALLDLRDNQNAKALVFDMRGNPGGLLIEAVEISNLFVNKGNLIVSTKGKVKQWDKSYETRREPTDTAMPIIVLVNRSSASASEIVSGAIQDLDRGVILGERTFGKGLVQTTRQLSYNSKLKVTTAKYYIPSGRCIQALDYSHRNEDGSVGKVPDSLVSVFSTKNGRKVYDGGGILPDVITKRDKISNIAISLVTKSLIFDYVTEFCLKNDSIANPKDFAIGDNGYNNFVNFLSDKEFDYETVSEEKLEELIKTSKKEKYYELIKDEIEKLKGMLAHDKNKDLNTFKEEISKFINAEISSRYYYQNGRIENTLSNDKDIDEALTVLSDLESFNKILEANGDNGVESE